MHYGIGYSTEDTCDAALEYILGVGVCDIEKKLYLYISLDFFDNDN